ncbi:MAG: NAD(P)H-binding protein [Cellvibrionaceae bacterium]|nr:NAD(P)H-binding protein [Cellvibrionaceae bacterium]
MTGTTTKPQQLAITGANGFIGKQLVKQALAAGHNVLTLSRSPCDAWPSDSQLRSVYCDYSDSGQLAAALTGCDCVIHLAAAMSGDQQYQQTLAMSQQLLNAVLEAGVKHLISISSIAILDYRQLPPLSTIDENTPLCTDDWALGDYAKMKRDQEHLFRQQQREGGYALTTLRPGLVYDDHQLSDAHAGLIKNTKGIAVSHKGNVPLVHVNYLAELIIKVATAQDYQNQTLHVLDEQTMDQHRYLTALKQTGRISSSITLPWQLYSAATQVVRGLCKLLGQSHKIPDSFRANSVAARQKPFIFSRHSGVRQGH